MYVRNRKGQRYFVRYGRCLRCFRYCRVEANGASIRRPATPTSDSIRCPAQGVTGATRVAMVPLHHSSMFPFQISRLLRLVAAERSQRTRFIGSSMANQICSRMAYVICRFGATNSSTWKRGIRSRTSKPSIKWSTSLGISIRFSDPNSQSAVQLDLKIRRKAELETYHEVMALPDARRALDHGAAAVKIPMSLQDESPHGL